MPGVKSSSLCIETLKRASGQAQHLPVQFNKPRVESHKRSAMAPTSGQRPPRSTSRDRQGFAERQNHYGLQVRPTIESVTGRQASSTGAKMHGILGCAWCAAPSGPDIAAASHNSGTDDDADRRSHSGIGVARLRDFHCL